MAANAARQQDLLRVAAMLFGRDGFAGVSIGEIARLSGISKTTIYSRYPDKTALFGAICSYACRVPSDAFRQVATVNRAPRAVLEDFADAVRTGMLHADAIDFMRLTVFEAGRFPDIAAGILEQSRSAHAPLTDYLRTLAAAGRISGDPALLADHFIALITGGWRMLLVAPDSQEARARHRAALDLFLGGINLVDGETTHVPGHADED